MKHSIQVIFLVCFINLLDIRFYGTEAALCNRERHSENDGDSVGYFKFNLPTSHGCTNDADSIGRRDGHSKQRNEILIENNKHFHEHNNNYLLVALRSSEGAASESPEELDSREDKLNTVESPQTIVQEPTTTPVPDKDITKEETPGDEDDDHDEELELEDHDDLEHVPVDDDNDDIDEEDIHPLRNKLNYGRRGGLRRSRYQTRPLFDDDEEIHPLKNELNYGRNGVLRQSKYQARLLGDRADGAVDANNIDEIDYYYYQG